MTKFLGESTCKEFAREGKVAVTILRVAPNASAESVAAEITDALTGDHPVWQIVHVE